MQDAYRLTADDRVLHKTRLSFDVSVWEMFWPLLDRRGWSSSPVRGHQRDPTRLARLIDRHRVTTAHFVPVHARRLPGRAGRRRGCAGLRRVICSGEALDPELAHRFHATCGAALHNLYGPTEASVDVTALARAGRRPTGVRADRPADLEHPGARPGRLPAAGAGRAWWVTST